MIGNLEQSDRRLFVRRCVACGYDGELLRGGQAPRCARCGCDLKARPARSYAEMEGLLGEPAASGHPLSAQRREQRCIQRWLAFLFIAVLGLLGLAYLSAAALPA